MPRFRSLDGRTIATLCVLGMVLGGTFGMASVTARAPPEPVCGVCTQALDQAADEHGVVLERGHSTMTVQVYANGTATFTARVTLIEGAERLRNATRRRAIVQDVEYIVADDRRHLRTWLDGTTLVVGYGATVAHRSLGVVRFDAFETRGAPPLASGGEGPPYPGADRLVLRAPPGYEVRGSYRAVTNRTAIVWLGDSHERFAGHIEEDVVISFTPTNATLPGVRVALAGVFDWVSDLIG